MNVYEIIDIAKELRPGNTISNDMYELWLAELDASIQLEVCRKSIPEIRRLRPQKWMPKAYKSGDRVSYKMSEHWHIYVATDKVNSNTPPCEDAEHWDEIPYETYVGFPHDKLYYLYLIAMQDYTNMEYDKYANDKALFDTATEEYAKWWQRKYSHTYEDGVDEYETDIRHPE